MMIVLLLDDRHLTGAKEVANAMEDFHPPVVGRPALPDTPRQIEDPNNAGQNPPVMIENPEYVAQDAIWKAALALIPKKQEAIEQQLHAAYIYTWNSCNKHLQANLKALPNYQQIRDDKNVIQLGLQIRAIACGVETSHNKIYLTVQLSKKLHTFYQKMDKEEKVDDEKYLREFNGILDALEQQGGTLCQMPGQVEARALQIAGRNNRAGNPNAADQEAALSQINEEIRAAYFLSGAHSHTHGTLKDDLSNLYLAGNKDVYPKSVADAMQLMEGWRLRNAPHTIRRNDGGGGGDDGLSFAQTAEVEDISEDVDSLDLQDEPAEENVPALSAGRRRKKKKKKKSKVKFSDNTKDAAGNDVIPHQSHATSGLEEEEEIADAPDETEECPHCNGNHSLADCPDVTTEELEELYLQMCEEEEAVDEEMDAGFFQLGSTDADGLVDDGIAVPSRCPEPMVSCEVLPWTGSPGENWEYKLQGGGETGFNESVCTPATLEDAVLLIQDGAILLTDEKQQIRTGGLRQNRLYLDTCTTSELMANRAFLTKIHQSGKALTLHTNAGSTSTNLKGYLGSIEFWLDDKAMASVVSLRTLEKKFPKISYCSTEREAAFIVTTPNGEVVFQRCEVTGFPFIDLTEHGDDMAVQLVQADATKPTTIRKRYEGFTRREVEQAIKARRAQAAAGFPSDATMKKEVSRKSKSSLYKNCTTTSTDITNAKKIFGPSVPCLKSKQVRRKPDRVDPSYVSVPADIIKHHKFVILAADVMFVCGMPFLISLSRGIRFVTVQYVPRRTAPELANAFKNILALYSRAGFVCQTGLMDGEFEAVKQRLAGLIEINTTAANEHVPEIERKIRHMKERCRATKASLPYDVLPNLIVRNLVTNATMMMNAHIDKQGISEEFSPRELVLRWQLDWKKHCRAPFGVYCIAYDDPSTTNTMQDRATEAIYLGPTGNHQGTCKFLSLKTKKIIKRRKFDVIPTPDSVIKKINSWGRRDQATGRLVFRDRNNNPYDWEEEHDILIEDNAIEQEEPEPAPYPDIPAEIPGVELERDQPAVTADPAPTDEEIADAAAANADFGPVEDRLIREAGVNIGHDNDRVIEIDLDVVPAEEHEIEEPMIDEEDESTDEDYNPDDDEEEDDDESLQSLLNPAADDGYESSDDEEEDNDAPRRSGRERRSVVRMNPRMSGRSHDDVQALQAKLDEKLPEQPILLHDDEHGAFAIIVTQLSLRQGLKVFGERGEAAALKEVTQLHDMSAFFPRDPKSLTREERVKALSSLIFLKEKRSKEIKARSCINGAPQREYIPKEEATSPTVNNDSIFITGAVDAYERRSVGMVDVPGAFLHTWLTDEKVIMVLKGELCELIVKVDPKLYTKYVTIDSRGKKVLYVQLSKALYGLLRAAILFYRKLRKELEDYGFEINPYDPCVANKMTECGKQITVLWHVDDLKISCENDFEITKLWSYLNKIYGGNMKIRRGTHHEYLGMDLDYSEPGVFKVSMIPYIDKIHEDFPEEITSGAPTPHADYLFKIRDKNDPKYRALPEEQALAFHHAVAQLLYLSQRARRDIQTAVSFLTTRVREPDEDDWGKVKRVLKYLKSTRTMPLRLVIEQLKKPEWDIDASHAVHEDCKGHTGAGMTLGRGAVMLLCRKQKVNTRSSTETELVGVDDAIGSVLWSLYFMQAQGLDVKCARIYQDNNSAILLEVNGRQSSTKRTKHIKTKFFFVKDKIDQGEIEIRKRDTEDMWSDTNTKPKQGSLYRKDRSMIMGCPMEWPNELALAPGESAAMIAEKDSRISLQECVGRSESSSCAWQIAAIAA